MVPLTKQESQTLVPSFSVKSILRLESISAPHFPHSSWTDSVRCSAMLRRTANSRRGALSNIDPKAFRLAMAHPDVRKGTEESENVQ
jgi:hypothetical protein